MDWSGCSGLDGDPRIGDATDLSNNNDRIQSEMGFIKFHKGDPIRNGDLSSNFGDIMGWIMGRSWDRMSER